MIHVLLKKPVWQMNGEELLELQRLAAPQRAEFAEVKEPRLVYGRSEERRVGKEC